MFRKMAFVSVLPHTKNLTERRFNMEIWPIDEKKPDNENYSTERIKKIQKSMKDYNKALSESRRKKAGK